MKYIKLFEYFDTNQVTTTEDLINLLKKHSVPVDSWGTGNSKTVGHLMNELKNKECSLEDKGEYLTRYIEFVGIRVYYKDEDDCVWVLKEDKQEFNDGRVRKRTMPSSVSEKMKFGEDPLISAIRGIEEELGVKVEGHQLRKYRDLKYDGGSMSYPGLETKYKGHQYVCYFDKSQFDPNGYIEIQKDKKTFFVWYKKD